VNRSDILDGYFKIGS